MATISIADNDARVQYTQAVTANTTQLTIDFPFFDNDDINVIVTSAAGVDTTLTRGTGTGTFAVVGTSVDDGFSGGYVTLGDTYSDAATKYTIFRDIDVERTTDFPTSGPFNISSLNTELDKIFAIEQELETKIGRTMKLADSDTAATLSLPNLDTRKGTVLAFNTTTGLPEAGPEVGDVSTIAAITTDIGTLADIEDGTDATDAIQTVAGISSDVTTVSGISANVTTVAGISANVTTVAGDSSDITALAAKTTELGRLGTADAVSDLNTLGTADVVSDMNTLATASNVTNMDTLAGISANITTVAGISANVTTVAGDSADIQAVAADAADIGTVASNISDVNTAATNITDIQNASTNAATATTKAAEAATSATNAATSATNASTSATNAATSATAAAASQTAAAASAASAASAFDNFDDTYLGSKTSDPTTDNDGDPLTDGDLYFNTTANEMRVYDGANWIAATSAGNVSLILYEYTATAGQTTFSGSDDNSATLSYTADNLQVVMNGVVLDPSDFTATNGTSVVLASGAALNDIVNIYAFKSFTTADMVSASAGGTFNGNVAVNARLDVTSSSGNRSASFVGSNASQNHHIFVDASGASSTTGIKISNSNSNNQSSFYHSGGNDALYVQVGQTSGGETTSGTNVQSWTSSEVCINEGSADVDFRVESNGNANMLFVDGGNNRVGIGTGSPVCNLHVKSSGNAELRLEETGGDIAQFVSLGDEFRIGAVAANKMTFRTGNTERMRIMPSGRMEFQTPTAETGVLQGQRIDWRNENNAGIMAGIGVVRTAALNAPGAFVIRTSNDVDSALNNSDGNISEKFRVAPNGDLTATDTSISSNSDQRLKENIADFEYDLTKFKQFQTRTFDWKQPHLHGDRSDVRGFIAQELEAVDSYWVQEIEVQSDSDDYQYLPDTDLQYGPNNNYKPDDAAETDTERTARFAKTSRLGQKDAMYVSVIQQLLTKIETLETKVAALEAAS